MMKIILGTMTFGGQVDIGLTLDMINVFKTAGYQELDTAHVYNQGKTELLLGELESQGHLTGLTIAGKANPWEGPGLSPEVVKQQSATSLERLRRKQFDLFYLHAPDLNTPIEATLEAISSLYSAGKIQKFGLSNYAAWQVAEIYETCRHRGFPLPVVYQGMYNALTRDVERELFPCLQNYNIAFYVYNPLAGGLLSGKHQNVDKIPESGRFATFNGYVDRYWKPEYFSVVNHINEVCHSCEIQTAEAALRWLVHHSSLSGANNPGNEEVQHGLILGASRLAHLQQNLDAVAKSELPDLVVSAFDEAWDSVRPACIKYFRP